MSLSVSQTRRNLSATAAVIPQPPAHAAIGRTAPEATLALWPAYAPIPEACDLSGMSRSAIYRAAGAGQIVMRKLGRSALVDMASLKGFLDSLPAARIAAPAAA
jgi:hypothetical protein